MFSSLFSTSPPVDPTASTLHPVSAKYEPSELYGELEPNDTEWLCAGGFVTETQTFYTITEDGSSIMCQVIHSSIGVWYPTIQFVCKVYNPNTKETIWKSVNVSKFITPPPGLDKRSSKADEFSITYKSTPTSDTPESYTISANLSDDLQISLDVSRPRSVPGFKLGKGPAGGMTYFGADPQNADGYVVHRFWPRTTTTGHIIHKGKALAVKGPGMLSHAIQGMRPNLVASSWNFANFQSDEHGGVSAMQMEFTTTDAYGRKGAGSGGVSVNVGSLVLGGKLACVTAEAKWPDEKRQEDAVVISRATHVDPVMDAETGYNQPTKAAFRWAGPPLLGDEKRHLEAKLAVELGDTEHPIGLIEKVDLLAEIPYVVKMAVNYVAGTKPYIYQWINPTKLFVSGSDSVFPGLSGGVEVNGHLYYEATFISA